MFRLLSFVLPLLLALAPPANAQEGAAQEALLSSAEKKAIQEALVWAGHYEASIDGAFGPATRSAIRQFQEAEGFRPSGYLRQRHVDRLLEVRREWAERFGWEIRRFPELGLEVGIPSALFRPPEALEHGLRFRSKEDQPRSELRLYTAAPMSDGRFEALREELIDREHFSRETYDAGDQDWFVFSGTSEAGVEQYTYVVNGQEGVRGFSFRYLERHGDELSRLNVAMYNSLQTFPAADTAAVAAAEPRPEPERQGTLFSDRELALLEDGTPPAEAAPERERQSVGFLVNPDGAILTTASAIDGCERIRVNRRVDASISAIDRAHDLALLSVPTGGRDFPHLSFRGEPIGEGERMVALTYGPGERSGLAAVPGQVDALSGPEGDIRRFRVSSELRSSSRGAPILDQSGRVAGLAIGSPAGSGGGDTDVLDRGERLAMRSDILEAFLGAHGVAYDLGPADAEPQPEVPPATRLATLRIECVR